MTPHQFTSTEIEKRLSFVRTIGFVLMVSLLVFGVSVGGKTMVDARALLADHTEVTGEVVDKEIILKRGRKGRTIKDHMVTYAAVAPNGSSMVERYETNKTAYGAISPGDPVAILFSNSDSAVFDRKERVERQASFVDLVKRLAWLMGFAGAMFAAIYFLSKAKLQKQLADQAPHQMPAANEAAG